MVTCPGNWSRRGALMSSRGGGGAPWESERASDPETKTGDKRSPFDANRYRRGTRDERGPDAATKEHYNPIPNRGDPWKTRREAATPSSPSSAGEWKTRLLELRPSFGNRIEMSGRIDSEVHIGQEPLQRVWAFVVIGLVAIPFAIRVLLPVIILVVGLWLVLAIFSRGAASVFGRAIRTLLRGMSGLTQARGQQQLVEVRRFQLQELDSRGKGLASSECRLRGFLVGGTLRPRSNITVYGRRTRDGVIEVARVVDQQTGAAVTGKVAAIGRLNDAVKPLFVPLVLVVIGAILLETLLHAA